MSTTEEAVLPNEDAVLAYTHQKRVFVINELIKDNKLPEDPAEKKIILTALADMDRAALTRKRIKADEKSGALANAQAANMIAELLSAAGGQRLFQSPVPIDRAAPVLGADIPEPVLVVGETATSISTTTLETFAGNAQPNGEATPDD